MAEIVPQCSLCNNKDSVIWRKSFKDGVLCNQCFINKYLTKVALSHSNACSSQDDMDNDSILDDNLNIRKSQRVKNKQKSSAKNLVDDKGKGRRSLVFKKNVTKSICERANITTSNHFYYKGVCYQSGDIVALTDISGDVFYAQIKGFIKDAYLNIGTYLQWLIPNTKLFENAAFSPLDFSLGYEENTPIDIDRIEFVCRLPPDFYLYPKVASFAQPYVPGDKKYIYTTLKNITDGCKQVIGTPPSDDHIFMKGFGKFAVKVAKNRDLGVFQRPITCKKIVKDLA